MQTVPHVEAVDRALSLLLALAEAGPDGAQLGDLAERTGLNKSTAYRSLSTMRSRGFADQHPSGNYRLGPVAMGLGSRFLTPDMLAELMHPALVAVSREADELVHFGVAVDDQVLYAAKVEPARAIRVWSAVGERVPMATTALGRAILAGSDVDDDQLAAYVKNLPTERQLTADHLRAVVRQARRRGYSTELEENERGVACLGMAVLREDRVIGALSITTLAARMTSRRQGELADLIRREVPPLLPDGFAMQPVGR